MPDPLNANSNICVNGSNPCAGITCNVGNVCVAINGIPSCQPAALTVDTCCVNNLPSNSSGCSPSDICTAGATCCQTSLNVSGPGSFTCCNSNSYCVPVPSTYGQSNFSPTANQCVPRTNVCSGITCSPGYACVPDARGRPSCRLDGTCCFNRTNAPCSFVDVCPPQTTCCSVRVDSNYRVVSNGSICCASSTETCFPNPVAGSPQLSICSISSDPCSGVTCPTGQYCTASFEQPFCEQIPSPIRTEVSLTSQPPGAIGSAILLYFPLTNQLSYFISYSIPNGTSISAAFILTGSPNTIVLDCCSNPISGMVNLSAPLAADFCSGLPTSVILLSPTFTLEGAFSTLCQQITCARQCINNALCAPPGASCSGVTCPVIGNCYSQFASTCQVNGSGQCDFMIDAPEDFYQCANSSCPGLFTAPLIASSLVPFLESASQAQSDVDNSSSLPIIFGVGGIFAILVVVLVVIVVLRVRSRVSPIRSVVVDS